MNPTTIAEMQAAAAVLRDRYPGQSVLVQCDVAAYSFRAEQPPSVAWGIHVIADRDKGLDGERIDGAAFATVEAQIHEALDPAKKQARALARAAALEAEAAALRASVGGAA